MNLFDEKLYGQTVTQVVFVHNYLQIVFAGEMTLTINNNYAFVGGQPNEFIDTRVLGTFTTDTEFKVRFSDGLELSVGIADQDYVGPEAMVLQAKDSDIIVWQ